MTTGHDIVDEARSYIEPTTPWQHNQSRKGVGCDCIGLLVGVAHKFGLADDWEQRGREFHAYSIDPDPKRLLKAVATFFDQITLSQARLGDILLFRLEQHPKHFGIISALEPRMSIIHAYASAKSVCEMPIDEKWRRRIHSAHRYRGV